VSNNPELRLADSSNALAPVYILETKRIELNSRYNLYRKNVRTILVTVSTSRGSVRRALPESAARTTARSRCWR